MEPQLSALQATYIVLGSAVAFASLCGLCWRYAIRPVLRAFGRLVAAVDRVEEHATSIAELRELLEATVVVVLDASDTLQTITTHLGIQPALSLARAQQERRVAERRIADRRRSS